MELKSQTNTFNGGMDLDTDVTQLPASKYREAENIRILANDASTAGALQNIEDIRAYGTILDDDETILGTAVTNWYCEDTDKVEHVGVVVTKENYNNVLLNNIYVVRDFDNQVLDVRLILSLKQIWTERVSLVTNYEKESVCHLYIANGEQEIKTLNLQKDYGTTKDDPLKDTSEITILPKGVVLQPQLDNIIEGALTGGTYVYVCQLYELNGGQAIYSPASELIRLTSAAETEGSSFKGDSTLTTTNKGVRISCEFYSGLCDRLRFIRCYYKSSVDQPTCEIVAEINVEKSEKLQSYTLEDGGIAALSTITTSDLNELINRFVAQTIVKYKNRMFAANIKQYQFDVEDYDTRAYRCNVDGKVKLVDPTNTIECDIQDILSGKVVVPEECFCQNPLNSSLVYPAEKSEDEYAFTADKTVRGGTGLNISYEFFTTTTIEDAGTSYVHENKRYVSRDPRLYSPARSFSTMPCYSVEREKTLKEINVDSTARQWNARSSYVCNNFTGYFRDGIYRFGIIFVNKNGSNSPVHWIDDIRFPAQTVTGYDAFSFTPGSGVQLMSRPLGIKFTVNNLPKEVKAYKIVRVMRTAADRNVVTQGLLSKTIDFSGWSALLDKTNPDFQECFFSKDRRPPQFPSFFKGISILKDKLIYPVGAGYLNLEQLDISTYLDVVINGREVNEMDKTGVYTFVSPDLCFNQQNASAIVTKNMFINPITLLDGTTFVTIGTNVWTGETKTSECVGTNIPKMGYDGLVIDSVGHSVSGMTGEYSFPFLSKKATFASGGMMSDADGSTANMIKYYKRFDKRYASSDFSNKNNYSFAINEVIQSSYVGKDAVRNEENQDVGTFLKRVKDYAQIINSTYYVNTPIGSRAIFGIGGVSTVLYSPEMQKMYPGTEVNANNSQTTAAFCPMLVNIYQNVVPYGGYTYNAKTNSIYSVTVKSANADTNEVFCFGGDTYLTVLDYAHCYRYNTTDPQRLYCAKPFVGYYLPTESIVNNYYRTEEHFSETITFTGDRDSLEGAQMNIFYGLKLGESSDTGYIMTTDAYKLNSSYNLQPALFKYAAQQKDTDLVSVRRTTITASELKTNGETIDKFRTFKFANYIETDQDKGAITNLKVFQDKLYFFQDEAVGVAAVNERSLIQDSNSNAVNIGTGDVLARYDYLVTKNGDSIINDKSIVSTDAALYWYDYDKNTICVISNGFRELSKEKNVQSYLQKIKDKDRTQPVSLYDKKYNEVWFKIYDKSLIFNERTNCFTSFYTHDLNWSFELTDKVVTVKSENDCYLLNTCVKESTGRDEYISKIRFLINQEPMTTKTYDNQWFSAELTDAENKKPQIIKDVYFETKTQSTEPIDYTSIENREDTYRFAINREKLTFPELHQQTSKSFASRMKGKYMICNYTFDCNNNREFKLPYITTIYRHSLL